MISKLTKFIGETKIELNKVAWPTRDESIRLTKMVILISVFFGVYLGVLDYGFTRLLNQLISN
jgi:preprotein translocase subunit SecE